MKKKRTQRTKKSKHLPKISDPAVIYGIVLLLLFFVPLVAFGQPGLPDEPEQTPIDGGLGILAAAGGVYAIKKLRDRNKN